MQRKEDRLDQAVKFFQTRRHPLVLDREAIDTIQEWLEELQERRKQDIIIVDDGK